MSNNINYYKKIFEKIKEPKSSKDYKKIISFEEKKFQKYIRVFKKRYNEMFNENFNYIFYEKILFNFLKFHIHSCYRIYRSKNILNSKSNKFISDLSLPIPHNQTIYRQLYYASDIGQKKLIIEFLKIHKKIKTKINRKVTFNFTHKENKKIISIKSKTENFIKSNNKFHIIANFIMSKLIKPKILVSNCYWSYEDMIKTKYLFGGKMIIQNFLIYQKKSSTNLDYRKYISKEESGFDDFDKFFFSTLFFSLPKTLLEDLKMRIIITNNFLNNKKFKEIRYILNESKDEHNHLLIALGKLKKIKSVYIDHNWLLYPFLGNWTAVILRIYDKYLSLGWKDKKVLPGGSLSKVFKDPNLGKESKKYIFFLSGNPQKRSPYSSSIWSECGHANSKILVNNTEVFFKNLSNNVFKELKINRHPKSFEGSRTTYNKMDEFFFKKKEIKSKICSRGRFIEKISFSKLTIVTNFSTAFIQCLFLDKPVLAILNKEAYFFEQNHMNFFNDLIKVKIISFDPKETAVMVNKIHFDPLTWWNKPNVKNARESFIKKNINRNKSLYINRLKKILN